jgi:hypothetical protein
MNECIFAAGARNFGVSLRDLAAGASLYASYRVKLAVAPGQYTLSLGCSAAGPEDNGDPNIGIVDDRHEGIGPIEVVWPSDRLMRFYGKTGLDVKIDYLDHDQNLASDLLRH